MEIRIKRMETDASSSWWEIGVSEVIEMVGTVKWCVEREVLRHPGDKQSGRNPA